MKQPSHPSLPAFPVYENFHLLTVLCSGRGNERIADCLAQAKLTDYSAVVDSCADAETLLFSGAVQEGRRRPVPLLVLLDWDCPPKPRAALIRRMRQDPSMRWCLVVALTEGFDPSKSSLAAEPEGIVLYMRKPKTPLQAEAFALELKRLLPAASLRAD